MVHFVSIHQKIEREKNVKENAAPKTRKVCHMK